MAEIRRTVSGFALGRYGILEVQTMDFHGSYRAAVANLRDALRLHGRAFSRALREHPQWLSERIEGPNIANVFKRTFYQMMLKFRIAAHAACAGCVLAIPISVWDSWQRHLARPVVRERGDGTSTLVSPNERQSSTTAGAATWIYVFDIDAASAGSPSPIRVLQRISADVDSLAYFALKAAPEAAMEPGGSADLLLAVVRRRLAAWWPEMEA